ncbi:MAG TPA: carboxypeptidase-like regulatory domain-containing protein [Terriglobales bacterium]|nr:carboxypeptidase-like regulatory domain-containing protein [Terriglobales bacterium]
MNQNLRKVLLLAAFGALLVSLAPYSAFADNVYATIRGTVADSTGAVVAGTQVTATNTLTGVKTTTVSRDNGLYEFLQLPVGNYIVSATKQGFKTFKSTAFTLTVNQTYALPVSLQIGVTNEVVEVKADAVQVETTSIQQQTLINSQQIVDLPLVNRNFTALEQLAPGVMASSDRFTNNFSVNGSQSQQSSYLINGTDSNDIALNSPLVQPSPDAIQEFNLVSSTINPEYGRNSGGIVNALIKNGTNQFHGDIFDFYRDTFLNTHNFFQKTAPVFHQHQFGGTVGGPIWKDKTFFFFSYQGLRARSPQNVGVNTVFSQAERSGNLADLAAAAQGNESAAGTPIGLTGDDGVFHPAGTPWFGASGAIFNGNPATNPNFGILPASDFNAISAGLLNKFVPLPNAANNQFIFNPISKTTSDQEIVRIDHNISSSDTVWGSMIMQHAPTTSDLPFIGASLPGFGSINTADTKQFTVAYNHTFNPTTLNEVRLGYSRLNFDAVEPQTPTLPSAVGFTGINPQNTKGAGVPTIDITGFFNLGFSDDGPQPRKDQTYQVTDNFSKITGRHSLKFGFDARRFQVDNPFFFLNNGHFDFGGAGNFTSGNAGLDFLLGVPDDFAQNTGGIINARAYEYYTYAQDQWKVKNNLTLTYGAGYQIDTPYNNNQFGGLDFNCFQPGAQSTVFPTAPAGILFPGDAGLPGSTGCNKSGTNIKYGHLGPRFGFAWSPDLGMISGGSTSKFSIRGGYGIYFNRTEEETALQNLGAPPFGLSSSGITDLSSPTFTPQPGFANPFTDTVTGTTLTNKFPFAGARPGDTSFDFSLVEPFDINTVNPNLSTPYSQNFNLNVQREFPSNTVVSVGYVGALGRHLYRQIEANPITLAGAAECAGDPTCRAFRVIQHAAFPDHSIVDGSLFHSVEQQVTDGTSDYNALQVSVNKGTTHGLQLITSYTWSHSIDNGSSFENAGGGGSAGRSTNIFFPELNVGDSAQDARQRLVLGYIYQIPSLHSMMSWVPDRIFGGWQMSGITTFQTGFPIDIGDSGFRSLTCDAFSFTGGCPDNPNQVAATPSLNPRTSTFKGKGDFWFDPTAFTRAPLGTFGNVRRNSLHGPGINNTDFNLIKNTKITEKTSFQIGMEGYNIFNHTQFNNPNGNAASANFGRVLSAAQGRVWQIRGKITF